MNIIKLKELKNKNVSCDCIVKQIGTFNHLYSQNL